MVSKNKGLVFNFSRKKYEKKDIFMIQRIEIFVMKFLLAAAVSDKKLKIFIFIFLYFNSLFF